MRVHLKGDTILFKNGEYFLISCMQLSRCFEIFYAFLRDSYDKLIGQNKAKHKPDSSKDTPLPFLHFLLNIKNSFSNTKQLAYPERLILAFRSYIELIFNFAILYVLLPSGLNPFIINGCKKALGFQDALYLSGLTITTIGYGDITPLHWFPKFLTVFEAMCGIIIIVVCFTVYVSLAFKNKEKS